MRQRLLPQSLRIVERYAAKEIAQRTTEPGTVFNRYKRPQLPIS